jgi:hypothetical protein
MEMAEFAMWSIVTLMASRCHFEQMKCHANGRFQGLFPRSDLQMEEMDIKSEDSPHCSTGHLFQGASDGCEASRRRGEDVTVQLARTMLN